MADKVLFGLLVAAFITAVHCGEYCSDYSDDYNSFWCDGGCCGDLYDRHCCVTGEVGLIIGIVVGCIVFIGIIISVIVCVCCCKRKQARQGQVIGNNVGAPPYSVTTQMAYPQTGYPTGYPQPYTGPYPAQPSAGQYPAQPPAGDQQYAQQFAQPPPPYADVQSK